MTDPTGDRAALIQKLLKKAEAKGTTQQERDTFNAKAAELMIKWGVDDAMLADAQRVKTEKIIQRIITTDVPKSYSFEATLIGVHVATAFSCKGLLQKMRDGRTSLLVVGFESDTERVAQLYASLAAQCIMELGPWYREWASHWTNAYASGTDKFNAKRSFIRGYASGVDAKLRTAMKQVMETATAGTDLVLIDRTKQVDRYVASNMRVGSARRRLYGTDGHAAGREAGLRANTGTGQVGNDRRQIGG